VKYYFVFLAFLVSSQAEAYALRYIETGEQIRWHKTSINIILDPSLALLGPIDEVELAIMLGFEEWLDKVELPLDFVFLTGSCHQANYHKDSENRNCVLAMKDSWQQEGDDIGAKTSVTYASTNGEILDADIVFNASSDLWNGPDTESNNAAIRIVAIHEAGHLLGLAHTTIEEALMFPRTSAEKTDKQNLHRDDIEGAHVLYEQFWEEKGEEIGKMYGCVAAVTGQRPSGWILFIALVALGLGRRELKSYK